MTDSDHDTMNTGKFVLPDLLRPNLDLVFCGTAAGNKSAETTTYYAHPSNKFWRTLFETGFTPTKFEPQDFHHLLRYGIGLTDLAKFACGPDSGLKSTDFDREAFRLKVEKYRPCFVGFNGKTAAKIFLNENQVDYGLQENHIDETKMFVLPSTSMLANRYWIPKHWENLAQMLNFID